MIISKLTGGLGNQMFQYAAGRSLSLKHKTELYLDVSEYKHYRLRKYSLDSFNIQAKLTAGKINSIKPFYKLEKIILSRLPFLTGFVFGRRLKLFKEEGLSFNRLFKKIPDNSVISGYFQSEKYFEDFKDTIKKDFTLKSEGEKFKKIKNYITDSHFVSLHIRRGDYASDRITNSFHGLIPFDYYKKAEKIMASKMKNYSYLVFTDDLKWAKRNLKLKNKMVFASDYNLKSDVYELMLMSFCQSHIIANSSYSWWGAWLSGGKGQMVIAPARWFQDRRARNNDIYLKNWIRL